MFEKIPSLKDFVLYLMPGIVICYLSLDIINILNFGYLTNVSLNDNSLSFVAIVSSFLLGFFCSQIQMISFSYFFKDDFRKMRTIAHALKHNEDLKFTVTKKIKTTFNLKNEIEKDDLIIFTCMSYIKSKANDNSQFYVERYNYLSSFAMTLVIPLTLGILDLLLRTKLENLQILIILLTFSFCTILILSKIIFNFREDFYINIFRQFLVTE